MKDQWLEASKKAVMHLDIVEGASSHLDQMDLQSLVEMGQRLWWVVKRANKILDGIKVRFRNEAQHGHARFDAPDGSHCLVIPHSAGVTLRKDADIEQVKKILGDRFDLFFEEVVTYKPRKDFTSRVASCPVSEQKLVMHVIDIADRTPRVVFKD